MESVVAELQHLQFRKRLWGYDPRDVDLALQQAVDQIQGLKVESASLRKDLQEQERELREYKEREKTIRNVLLSAHKTAEQMKANAEKEAKLIISDGEMKAEKVLQDAHQRLSQLHEDIAELRRQRIQLETKLRSTIEAYQQMLDMQKEDEKGSTTDPGKVKALNR
ncbi:MAG: DivIVA domain-containing protein [Syntrophobacteraceae bacterium]